MESFSASRGAKRMQPVFTEFPQKGMQALGFITNELTDESGKKLFVVFIPHTPNPTTGFIEIMDESKIVRTNISIENALKMVVSAGTVVPKQVAESLFSGGKPSKGD